MTAMFQGEGGYTPMVGQKMQTHLPGMTPALEQGSEGKTMSDLQVMMENERKQHEQSYIYQNGHNDGSSVLGTPSF